VIPGTKLGGVSTGETERWISAPDRPCRLNMRWNQRSTRRRADQKGECDRQRDRDNRHCRHRTMPTQAGKPGAGGAGESVNPEIALRMTMTPCAEKPDAR